MDYKAAVAQCVNKRIGEAFSADAGNFPETVEIPPDPNMGDFAVPCFPLSKLLRMAPQAIAAKLADSLAAPEGFTRVESAGGYLNFFLDRTRYAQDIVTKVNAQGENYAGGNEGEGKVVVIDYSSINIAKRFHIGHLSSTMIGHSLRRIYEHLGYRCIGVNHLGDWGTQFGKMVAAYKRWGNREQVEKGGVDALTELYVRFNQEAEHDPALENEGRACFKAIEDGDEEALAIFNWFKDLTLKDAQRVYDLLGVTFDSYAGESFYNDKMDRVVDELREKNLLVESDGAYMVDLEAEGMPPCLILKKDGATLYSTRDIAAALYRKDTYDFYKCLYVVAYQQDLHFKQWFKVVEKMGYPWAGDLVHVPFGMVSFEGQALATRKGHVVYLDDLLNQAVAKARATIEEKSPDLPNKDEVARKIGVGAAVFFDLYNNRIKDIDFYFERALAFEGETAPYVQYSRARCCSVLAKVKDTKTPPDWSALANEEAQAVVRALAAMPEVVREACQRNEPSMITRHVVDIAQTYNHYYFEHRILTDDAPATAARVALTRAVEIAVKTCLYLIGVEAPDKM